MLSDTKRKGRPRLNKLKNTNKLIEELDKAIEFAEQELNQKEVYKGQHELLKIQIANYKKMKSFFI
jgi:hypothetical protein